MSDIWPPNYAAIFAQRQRYYAKMLEDPSLIVGAKEYYKDHIKEFINDWCVVYEPRNAGTDKPTIMPFITFPRQDDFIEWVVECYRDKENGLAEKCRTVGATWLAGAISVALWSFQPGVAIGFGSNKANKVDELGNPDSILEKIRIIIDHLPRFFWPQGFEMKKHALRMKILNPENGASITGEGGDNIGRGGRKSLYFKDEAQPLSAGILTPYGWRTMADMRVGATISDAFGGRQSVIGINEVGTYPVYRVELRDGTSTECSINHLWTVDSVIGSCKRVTLPLSTIKRNFVYHSPGGQTQYRYRLPLAEAVEFRNCTAPPLDPYIVGVLLGDGYIGSGCVKFTSIDDEIVDGVKQALPHGCMVVSNGKEHRIGDIQRYTKSSRARNAVKAAGIYGKRAHDKNIPFSYKFGSVDDRLALLQGLMDTDGSASGGQCTFHTCSRELADDTRFIVNSLGGTASLIVKPDHRGFRDMYCMNIALPERFVPFRLQRKIDALTKKKRKFSRTIVSITYVGEKPVRCITVSSEGGLYLTDHCIVTHNSAHYERPEQKEAALSETTDVQIDMSSVFGTANVYARRRKAGEVWSHGKEIAPGKTRVFIFDWRDHPHMTQEWYDKKRNKAEQEGLLHIFAQEIDRDYAAAVEGVLIPQQWVKASIDAHKTLDFDDDGMKISALDVADEGGDRNAFVMRKGVILRYQKTWGQGDVGETTRKTIALLRELGSKQVQYDAAGIGSTVKAEYNRQRKENGLTDVTFVPWNGGFAPLHKNRRLIPGDKESPRIKDFYANLKAQGWWELRRRFERTFSAVVKGVEYDASELISIPSELAERFDLEQELSQPTYSLDGKGRIVVNKKPDGSKSPDRADSVMMCYWPIQPKKVII